ncbi:uncharacterized protein A4U43_C04F16490 [Asparagus officinalis]|uniref:Pentacotripeptide-repeat region of PRORP domain-containing protein n=2 Tax=Asparagus officinalis TaxID=4686 RepID=A0A5P1F1D0_ASPOF|nr:uncharacterized protein A4U43_C04F16490 [Asparagus officinalis]
MVESKGLAPDIICYNAVLYGYMKSGDGDGFAGILGEIEKRGLEPNVFTYNCRIAMFCGKSQSFKGEEILDVMESKGLVPNLWSFNELIDGFCKEGDLESAVRVFKRMKVMKRANGKEGFSPNSRSYLLLTRSLVEKGEFGLGLEICKESLVRKFVPPFEIVKGLVEGLAKNEKVEEAKDIIEKMNLVVTGEAVDAWKKIENSLAL